MKLEWKYVNLGNELHTVATLSEGDKEYYGSSARDIGVKPTDDIRTASMMLALKRAVERYELTHDIKEESRDIYAEIAKKESVEVRHNSDDDLKRFSLSPDSCVRFVCSCGVELQVSIGKRRKCDCGKFYIPIVRVEVLDR